MSSRYDKTFSIVVNYPFLWLWALITWFYSDPKISYHQAYKQHRQAAVRRLGK